MPAPRTAEQIHADYQREREEAALYEDEDEAEFNGRFWYEECRATSAWLKRLLDEGYVPEKYRRYVEQFVNVERK